MILIAASLVSVIFFPLVSCQKLEISSDECPLWYHPGNDGNCTCGNSLASIVDCSRTREHTIYLKDCFCMTLDLSQREPVVGSCIYTCDYWLGNVSDHLLMAKIKSKSSSEINNETCGRYNRQGVLCSTCYSGYGLSIYSYKTSCVPCKDSWYNLVVYVAVVYLPLTVFVFIIIFFRLNANSGSMIAYVTLSQMMSNNNITTLYLLLRNETRFKVLTGLYSIWNLEFFRPFLSHLCVHPNLSALQSLALDYLVAVYPMILVILTYLVVYLHGRSSIVVYLCRPLYTCLHHFRREWDMGNSLIEAFATLILISHVELLSISCNILSFTTYYYMNNTEGPKLLYADPSVEYLSTEHVPYFALAVTMLLIFNIMPLFLLCFYPYRFFQRILSHFRLDTIILQTFMDAFRGSYKLKPKWLQSFSAIYLLANFISIMLYFILKPLLYHSTMVYTLIVLLLLTAMADPCKNKWHNRINIFLTFCALLAYKSINNYLEGKVLRNINYNRDNHVNKIVMYLGFILLPIYGICLLCNYLIPVRVKNYIKSSVSITRSYTARWKRKPNRLSLPNKLLEGDDTIMDYI